MPYGLQEGTVAAREAWEFIGADHVDTWERQNTSSRLKRRVNAVSTRVSYVYAFGSYVLEIAGDHHARKS